MNKKMKNSAMNHSAILNQQKGVSTLLFTVLVGMSLTALSVGYISSLKTVQNSATTLHAQTQAQIKSAIGYQALTGLLKTLNATQIAQINNGVIKDNGSPAVTIATYKVVTTTEGCPDSTGGNNYFCYDITAKSGGASSVVRAIYADKTIGGGAFNGSIFAGGLKIGQIRNLQGNQTIQVGAVPGGVNGIVEGNGNGTFYTKEDFLAQTGITTGEYTPSVFMTAEDVRPYANYIFLADGTCAKNNLYSETAAGVITNITVETSPSTTITIGSTPVSCRSISGITPDSSSGTITKWSIDASKSTIPVGVLWFEGEVDIDLKSTRDLVNTIIAKGGIPTTNGTPGINVDTSNGGASNKAYAPYHYYLEKGTSSDFDIKRICGLKATGIPTQYCDILGALKALNTEMSKIANILFLSNGDINFAVKNNKPMFLYGNVMGSGGAGGTGYSSGKFNGIGIIDIKGNLTFTGSGQTTTNGNVSVRLNNSESGGSVTPSKKVMILSGLRYM